VEGRIRFQLGCDDWTLRTVRAVRLHLEGLVLDEIEVPRPGAGEQSAENPFGIGGMQLHQWLFPLRAFREMQGESGGEANASTPIVEGWFENIGATVMGRNMFGGGPCPWGGDPWTGFWGEGPPYHRPVFVLTDHAREPLEMQGGTTFISSPTGSSP
jgi:hypothetical protein